MYNEEIIGAEFLIIILLSLMSKCCIERHKICRNKKENAFSKELEQNSHEHMSTESSKTIC